MTDRKVMQQALECLEWHIEAGAYGHDIEGTAGLLRALLAEPEPEPVAFVNAAHLQGLTLGLYGYVEIYTEESAGRVPLYTAPPTRRTLTDEEIDKMWVEEIDKEWRKLPDASHTGLARSFARAIERAHKITGGNDE